jgi:hypothetical protein
MMATLQTQGPGVSPTGTSQILPGQRAEQLAERVERAAHALAAFTAVLTDAQWQTRVPKDGRTIGVIVHHVATVCQLAIQLADKLMAGQPVTVTVHDVDVWNATHAEMFATVSKAAALDLLWRNSTAAATAIRATGDELLERAAPVSLYGGGSVTCQFLLEDLLVRHSYHHLARIQQALMAHDATLARLKRQLEVR